MINKNTSNAFKYYTLFIIASIICLFLIKDYLGYIILGTFLAVLTYPMFNFFLKNTVKLHYKNFLKLFWKNDSAIDENRTIAAFVTIFTTFAVMLLSFTLFVSLAGKSFEGIIKEGWWETGIDKIAEGQTFKATFSPYGVDGKVIKDKGKVIKDKINDLKGQIFVQTTKGDSLTTAASVSGKFISGLANFFIYFIVFLFSWVVMLISGEDLVQFLYKFSFLKKEEQYIINSDFIQAIKNVILGNAISGTFIVLMMLVLGLIYKTPLLVIWMVLGFFIGFLPLSPSELAYLPILISIFFTDGIEHTIIVFVIIELYILIINNLILPRITAGKETNPLLILVSIFASISIFGFTGFIIGPVLVYFAMSLYKIADNRREQNHFKQ